MYVCVVTHPLGERVPRGRGVIEQSASERQGHLPEEVVSSEHVSVPSAQPQRAAREGLQRSRERQGLLEHGVQCVLLYLRLPFASLGLVGQQVHLQINSYLNKYIVIAN